MKVIASRRHTRRTDDDRRRRGGVLTIAGPDGTGKSTLCSALAAPGLIGGPVRQMHHRFAVLPGRANPGVDVTRPHAQHPYPAPLSWLKAFYVFADYLLGWQLHVRPFVAEGGWVLLERGWWDLAVDQRRYRLQRAGGLLKVLGRLLPRPDLLVVLVAPVGVLTSRKAELPAVELERQLAAWRTVVPRRVRRRYIDAGAPASAVMREVLAEMHGLIAGEGAIAGERGRRPC